MTSLTGKVAEIKVRYKRNFEGLPMMTSPEQAVEVFWQFFPLDTIALIERFLVAYLDNSGNVLGVFELSVGGINATEEEVVALFLSRQEQEIIWFEA